MAKIDRLSEYEEKKPIIWSDRKRYFGLPISFTVYKFDHDRFYVKTGFLNTKQEEILLYRVLDIKLTSTLAQKIFRVGTITIESKDKTTPELLVKNVKNAGRVMSALSKIVEDERNEKRVIGREMTGAANDYCDHDHDDFN